MVGAVSRVWKPVAVVNCVASATPSESCAAVVTRILYWASPESAVAGVTEKVRLSPVVGWPLIATQFTKLSRESWMVEVHAVPLVIEVIVPGVAAVLKVTLMELLSATFVAASAGVVELTEIAGLVVKLVV